MSPVYTVCNVFLKIYPSKVIKGDLFSMNCPVYDTPIYLKTVFQILVFEWAQFPRITSYCFHSNDSPNLYETRKQNISNIFPTLQELAFSTRVCYIYSVALGHRMQINVFFHRTNFRLKAHKYWTLATQEDISSIAKYRMENP